MKTDQPRIVPPKSSLQNSLDIIALLAIVGYMIFFLTQWPGLPDRIPIHFNGAGEPDGYGSKFVLLLFPLTAVILYFLLTYLNRLPYIFNYPVKITEANAERQYTLARNMMSGLNAGVILGFFYITWRTVSIIKGEATGLGAWFMPAFLAVIFVPIIIYFVQVGRK